MTSRIALPLLVAALAALPAAAANYQAYDDCISVAGGTACGAIVYSLAAFTAEGEATVSVTWQQCVYTDQLPTECSEPFDGLAYTNTMAAAIGWGCVSSTLFANGVAVTSTLRYC